MTYHELVKKVQTAMTKADASKVTDHIAVQVNVTGEAEGAFYMEIAEGVLFVAPYDYIDRDALLTADGENVLAVAQGKISLEAAIAEGKVAHEGNYEKTLALGAVIPAKKTAAKKAAKAEEAVKAEAPAEEAPKAKRSCKKACKTEAEAPAAEEAKPAKKATAKKAAKAEVKAEAPAEEKPKRGRKAKAAK